MRKSNSLDINYEQCEDKWENRLINAGIVCFFSFLFIVVGALNNFGADTYEDATFVTADFIAETINYETLEYIPKSVQLMIKQDNVIIYHTMSKEDYQFKNFEKGNVRIRKINDKIITISSEEIYQSTMLLTKCTVYVVWSLAIVGASALILCIIKVNRYNTLIKKDKIKNTISNPC